MKFIGLFFGALLLASTASASSLCGRFDTSFKNGQLVARIILKDSSSVGVSNPSDYRWSGGSCVCVTGQEVNVVSHNEVMRLKVTSLDSEDKSGQSCRTQAQDPRGNNWLPQDN